MTKQDDFAALRQDAIRRMARVIQREWVDRDHQVRESFERERSILVCWYRHNGRPDVASEIEALEYAEVLELAGYKLIRTPRPRFRLRWRSMELSAAGPEFDVYAKSIE